MNIFDMVGSFGAGMGVMSALWYLLVGRTMQRTIRRQQARIRQLQALHALIEN